MTIDDIDQIVEGIAQFIISGDPDVEEVWQPYLNKLATLRADLLVIETALDVLDASICECGHLDANHQFTDPAHNDIVDDCSGDNPPGFGNCGCREFRPVVFLVTRVPPAAADAVRGSTDEPLVPIRETTS